jgi:hypothetical protein
LLKKLRIGGENGAKGSEQRRVHNEQVLSGTAAIQTGKEFSFDT